jgi:hypothetical protein
MEMAFMYRIMPFEHCLTSIPARSSKVTQVLWAGPSRDSARRCSYSRRVLSLKDSLFVSSVALATLARRSSAVGEGARFPRPIPFLPTVVYYLNGEPPGSKSVQKK